jgi:hypothetical protein
MSVATYRCALDGRFKATHECEHLPLGAAVIPRCCVQQCCWQAGLFTDRLRMSLTTWYMRQQLLRFAWEAALLLVNK